MRRSIANIAAAVMLCASVAYSAAGVHGAANAPENDNEAGHAATGECLQHEEEPFIPASGDITTDTVRMETTKPSAASSLLLEERKTAEFNPLSLSKPVNEGAEPQGAEDYEDYIETAAIPAGTRTSLGVFTVTAYCSCSECCGKWSGHKMSIPTQAGVPYPVEGYTISVDPEVIPLRSVVELEGRGTRYAHDTGGSIKGKRIDLFFASHGDALEFGRQELEVWIYT